MARELTVIRWIVFSAAGAAIVLNAAAGLTVTFRPGLAAAFNPLNTDARVDDLFIKLAEPELSADRLAKLKRMAETIVSLSPADSRGYSLLGEVHRRAGEQAKADELYLRALEAAPTEINALVNRLRSSLRDGAVDEAVERLDVILRRYPEAFESVKPLISALAADASGAPLLGRKLAGKPPWRAGVVSHAMGRTAGRRLIWRLLVDERAGGMGVNVHEVAQLIDALIREGAFSEAYRVFLLTLSAEERRALGFVFDDRFRRPADRRRFNWSIRPNADADISMPLRTGARDSGGLAVRFRGTPARLGNIGQTLALPPGRYTISAISTAEALDAPKTLFWEVRCHAGGNLLVTLPMESGSYASRAMDRKFTVPAGRCGLQDMTLRTGISTSTWRALYRGTLIVHELRVTRER